MSLAESLEPRLVREHTDFIRQAGNGHDESGQPRIDYVDGQLCGEAAFWQFQRVGGFSPCQRRTGVDGIGSRDEYRAQIGCPIGYGEHALPVGLHCNLRFYGEPGVARCQIVQAGDGAVAD